MSAICLGYKRSKWENQEYFSWGRKVKMHKNFMELILDELYSTGIPRKMYDWVSLKGDPR